MSDLTASEVTSIRVALRFLKARSGSWDGLGRVLRYSADTLSAAASETAGRGPSLNMALRVARVAQVGVDDVLAGRYPGPNVCAHCGARTDEQAAE